MHIVACIHCLTLPLCGNQQRCLHFRLLLEDPFEQLSGIVKNVDRHGKPALFLIMTDSCLKIIQAKIKVVRRRKSVNNATISYKSAFRWSNVLFRNAGTDGFSGICHKRHLFLGEAGGKSRRTWHRACV